MTAIVRFALAIICGFLAAGSAPAEATPAPNDYLCVKGAPPRRIEKTLKFVPRTALNVRDRVTIAASSTPAKIDLRKPLALCLPVAEPGTSPVDAPTHYENYGVRLTRTRPSQEKLAGGLQRVITRFGSESLKLKVLGDVLVPTAALFDPPPVPVSAPAGADVFTCYDADRVGGARNQPVPGSPLTYPSALGTLQLDVRAPTRVCFPADLLGEAPNAPIRSNALACYRAKLARTKPPQTNPFPRLVATANRFGLERLALSATVDVCVSAEVQGVNASPTPNRTAQPSPTPTVTPPPGFTLRVGPAATTVDIGESAHFTATAVYESGDTVDFTERVLWKSSTAAGIAANELGDRGRIDAVDGGSTVISVLDEATGVTSTATGEDAILTVNWTLQRIELLPTEATRGQGESMRLRATGHFANGFTRSIAERLIYASNAPGIVSPANDPVPANHSRVVALAVGSAVLSATDPLSGVTSTQSGDDVALTVVPPLTSCEVLKTEIGLSTFALGVGDYHQLTAIGTYPGGFQRVITQQAQWTSDDPTVLEAPNTDGDRSRLLAVAPGTAHVQANDTVTGVQCTNEFTFYVGEPTSLHLQPPDPNDWRPIRKGRSWHAIAVERFSAPIDKIYATEKVIFTSSDPTIVAAPNVAGDRGRLDAVGSGTAVIHAEDPARGLRSQDIYLRSLDGLTRVEIVGDGYSLVDVGWTLYVRANGIFADGSAILETNDVTFTSDNPTVVSVVGPAPFVFPLGYWRLQALAPGQATISVTDDATGISSNAFGDSLRVAVRGPLERIELIPSTVTRRLGEAHPFAAVGYYVGGASELITDKVVYSSSTPNVAVATNDFYVRGRVDAVGGGTAVISARDPVSGISSTDSGGDATLTVIGTLVRVRIQPSIVNKSVGRSFSFTAIGTDGAGREVNVTQDVVWSSTDPNIARALNPEGNRSRVRAVGWGTATISAHDPQSGVSSTSSGDDATFTVDNYLASIFLSSSVTQLKVGDFVQLTGIGNLLYGHENINLTQELEYTSSNPSVVEAKNTPGDQSRVVALKPGVATISACDPGTGLCTGGNGNVTLIVVP